MGSRRRRCWISPFGLRPLSAIQHHSTLIVTFLCIIAGCYCNLREKNLHGKVIEIQFSGLDDNHNYIISISKGGDAISTNGFHTGVEFNGIVYCNVHPSGLPELIWINDFMGSGNKFVFQIPF